MKNFYFFTAWWFPLTAFFPPLGNIAHFFPHLHSHSLQYDSMEAEAKVSLLSGSASEQNGAFTKQGACRETWKEDAYVLKQRPRCCFFRSFCRRVALWRVLAPAAAEVRSPTFWIHGYWGLGPWPHVLAQSTWEGVVSWKQRLWGSLKSPSVSRSWQIMTAL